MGHWKKIRWGPIKYDPCNITGLVQDCIISTADAVLH